MRIPYQINTHPIVCMLSHHHYLIVVMILSVTTHRPVSQMVGISEYELAVEVNQLLRRHGLECSLSPHGHKHRSVDRVVGETHLSHSSLGDGTFSKDLER